MIPVRTDDLRLRGVAEGSLLAGPETLQVNLTSSCNLACVFCWSHSPLRPVAPPEVLSAARMRALRDALAALQPARVLLSGQGEPLLHPAILPLLATLRELRIPTTIQTNCTTGPPPDELARLGVEHLVVNASAATPAGYRDTHPGSSTEHGELIRRLHQLSDLRGRGGPAVTRPVVQRMR